MKAGKSGGPCRNDDGIDAWIKDEAIRMVRHVEARVRSIGGGPDVAMRLLSDAFTAAAGGVLARATEVSPEYRDAVRETLSELVGEQYREIFRDADGVCAKYVERVA